MKGQVIQEEIPSKYLLLEHEKALILREDSSTDRNKSRLKKVNQGMLFQN